MDFLLYESEHKYDIFIGNPPYVGKKSIDKAYAEYLKIDTVKCIKIKGIYPIVFLKKH